MVDAPYPGPLVRGGGGVPPWMTVQPWVGGGSYLLGQLCSAGGYVDGDFAMAWEGANRHLQILIFSVVNGGFCGTRDWFLGSCTWFVGHSK